MQSGPRLRIAWACVAAAALAVLAAAPTAYQSGRPSSNLKQSALNQSARVAVAQVQPLADARAVRRAASPARAYARGHIVVKFDRGLRAREIRELASTAGGRRIVRPAYADFQLMQIDENADPVAAAAALAQQSGVEYAEPDPIVRPLFHPNDPHYRLQWNLQKIGMENAWDINRGGSTKITVAVLDTGVAYLNQGAFAQAPDLAGAHFVAGYDFIWNDDTPVDSDGHGTHVTGTLAEQTNNGIGAAGIAFNVNVMPVKVLATDWDARQGAPNDSTMSVLAQGIRFAADHGANVINMSLGADEGSSAVESAIRYAVGKGVFLAVAAGNTGDSDNAAEWPASYAPAIDGLMAVAALDYNLARAPYSTHRDYVEIAAPGGNVDADLNNDGYGDGILQQTLDPVYQEADIFNRFAYMFYEGTSMATPHVAALAALLMDQGVKSPGAVEMAIRQTATNKPNGGRSNDIGYGVIDPRATLRGLGLAK